MEIIIGREEGARRLHCIVDGREFNIGQAGCVPASVSRKHCKISINGTTILVENIKPQNITFVNGNQIFAKEITANCKLQLGNEKYLVPLQEVLQLATGKANTAGTSTKLIGEKKPEAPTFSLLPLKSVWEEYDSQKLKIQEEAAKKANQQRIQGIVSMCGMALGLLPIPVIFRGTCVVIALCLAIYFFVSGRNSETTQRKLHDLDEKYAKKYKCPNPECGKPFGGVPYRQIEYNKQCFACGCKYTH